MGYEEVGDCKCKSCESGNVTLGHCVDIDGDYWHNCAAIDLMHASVDELN